ncbi:hypothetical protein ACFOW6_13440 [Fodinicurvata halophila]|uniref:Glycosyl transferase family 1 n=1 Tax=Fodinicurvata halophila TaxID=1419723 RepID=A0ABV8UPR6_9PROT
MPKRYKILKTRWARDLFYQTKFAVQRYGNPDFVPRVHIPAVTKVVWVTHSKFATLASSNMRGQQLAQIAQAHLGEDYDIDCIDERGAKLCRDSVLFLTKGYLKKATLQDVHDLKRNNNILCADFLDDPERRELSDHIDVYIASSIAQLQYYMNWWPDRMVHLVTHHVDPAIEGLHAQQEHFRLGYFGDADNARHRDRLIDLVDFHFLDNRDMNGTWRDHLPDYSMHYAVRQGRRASSFKPFLKGFTAAACGANILVSVQENDAMHYLGRDYPWLVADSDLASVRALAERAREEFGGPEWRRGLQVMESLCPSFAPATVAGQIRSLLQNL